MPTRNDAAVFSTSEVEKLRYYVYVYSDPDTDEPFYIGKGKGNRAFAHLNESGEHEKISRIAEIRARHVEPRIEILAFDLDEDTAFKVEAAAIDLIGFAKLTNRVLGHGASKYGRLSLAEVHARLQAAPVDDFPDECVVIRINASVEKARERLGRRFDGESPESQMALYDATRSAWVISAQRRAVTRYALADVNGVVREVYAIADWLPAGSTLRSDLSVDDSAKRWEFVGRIADDTVRDRYRLRSVAHLFKPGAVNPLRFFGPTQPSRGTGE